MPTLSATIPVTLGRAGLEATVTDTLRARAEGIRPSGDLPERALAAGRRRRLRRRAIAVVATGAAAVGIAVGSTTLRQHSPQGRRPPDRPTGRTGDEHGVLGVFAQQRFSDTDHVIRPVGNPPGWWQWWVRCDVRAAACEQAPLPAGIRAISLY